MTSLRSSFPALPRAVLHRSVVKSVTPRTKKQRTRPLPSPWILVCGKRGIRTPGTSRFNGFQDRRNRPLCHLSGDKSSTLFPFYQIPAGISPRALPACGGRRTAFLNGRLRPWFRPAACPLSVFLPCVARAVAVSLCRREKRSKRMFGKFLLTLSDTVRISRRRML